MNLSVKNYYWRWTKNLAFFFFVMAIFMTVGRVFFCFYFGDWNEMKLASSDLKSAFFLGLRYDLVPLAYINALPILLLNLLYFVPGKKVIMFLKGSLSLLLFVGYSLMAWVYISDYAFFSYFQDHINILFFGFFEDDTIALLVTIWKNYNLVLWLFIIFSLHYALYRVIKICFSPFDFDLKAKKFSWWMPLNFIVCLVLIAFFGRGNFTRLPLSIEDAHISQNEFINKVSLNGVITLNRTLKIRKEFGQKDLDYLERFGFKDWKEAYKVAFGKEPVGDSLSDALRARSKTDPLVAKIKPHVVLVVMESFGTYFNEKNGPSFNIMGELDKYFKEGILFNNFLPAENGTIGSIVSIATSQPIRPGARFLSESNYLKTPVSSAGHLPYKEAGYETHFVYGGKLGWRDLGKYLTVQKYDRLWGADEIREAMPELNNIEGKDLGNEWGIFDEYLYAFIEEQLRYATKPQFFMVLTTSNHPPFEWPSTYNVLPVKLKKNDLEKLTVDEELALRRFRGIQYANQKMAEFLSHIKLSALNEKTIVALTGDHSYWIAKGVGLNEEFKRYSVPFFIQAPYQLKPKNFDRENFGSHEDIFPTLYHMSLSNVEYVKMGENLFVEPGLALNSSSLVADKSGAVHHKKSWSWEDLQNQILKKEKTASPKLKELKKKREAMIAITDLYLKEQHDIFKSNNSN